MKRWRKPLICSLLLVAVAGTAMAQRRRWRDRSSEGDRRGVPEWEVNRDYPGDLFTFARIKYDSWSGGWGGGRWRTDWPDSDLNFSLRLHQLTTLKVNPDPVILELTDPKLFDYPFIYIIEPGSLVFSQPEREALRRYCLNGGFLMIDDFWGDYAYENLRRELAKVFPGRPAKEVPLEHEIFHCVYDLKEKPQIPALGNAYPLPDGRIKTWEDPRDGSDASTPYYKAIEDDEGRIMVFICHNTDLGDGWEREGEDKWYFEEFSVKKAYPLGINIVTYAMTH
ncbi:MAG: DUF4159 domain-containing protein [Planctomycetota bacterium]